MLKKGMYEMCFVCASKSCMREGHVFLIRSMTQKTENFSGGRSHI